MRQTKQQLEEELAQVIEDIREPRTEAIKGKSYSQLIQKYADLQRQYINLTGERYEVKR